MRNLLISFKEQTLLQIILIAFLFFRVTTSYAQMDVTYVTVTVNIYNKVQTENGIEKRLLEDPDPFYWGVFSDKKTAKYVCGEVKNMSGITPAQYEDFTGVASGILVDQIAFKNGYMYIMSSDFQSYAIVEIVDEDKAYEVKGDSTDHQFVTQRKIKGKNNYEVNLVVNQLKGGEGKGKRKRGTITGGTLPPKRKNNTEIFPIHIVRDSTYLRNKTRLVIQTYAVDCITEDLVAYCKPFVLENDEYHSLQDRRKSFNYAKHDSLHIGYIPKYHLKQGDSLVIDTFIEFVKPVGMENRHFRGPFKVFLEDYHHVIDSFRWDGTCLERDAWKFLNYGDVTGKIELSRDEFYEKAKIKINNVTRTLGLTYVKGEDKLVDNEENDSIKRELLHILKAYEVLKPKITGFSSPEGGYARNEDLARRRGRQAANFLRLNCEVEPKVATWEDVAVELDEMNQPEDAAFIRQAISESKEKDPLYDNGINAKLKNRDVTRYNEVIEPALKRLRKMEFSFGYIDSRPMEPQEAVEDYYRNKRHFLSGDSVCRYSNGDFFNLYLMIKDEAEQDTITKLAYEKLYGLDQFRSKQKFFPYLINRMALWKIKQGKPDSTILKPLIDTTMTVINYNNPPFGMNYKYFINRKEVIQNQAVIMFMMNNIHAADKLLSLLKKENALDSTVKRFISYVDLINFEGMTGLSEEEEQRYKDAKKAVLANDLNKAILYSELPEWEETLEAREKWTNLLDDSDPRKWYLKALTWVKDAGMEDVNHRRKIKTYALMPFNELSSGFLDSLKNFNRKKYDLYMQRKAEYQQMKAEDSKDKNLDVDNIPYYLAYFQHSFDLDDSSNGIFKRYYFNEGLVDDETRKKYPYRREDIPKYRKLFRMLKRYDNSVRERLLKSSKQ